MISYKETIFIVILLICGAFCAGGLLACIVIKYDAIKHHAVHYDAVTGSLKWNDESEGAK